MHVYTSAPTPATAAQASAPAPHVTLATVHARWLAYAKRCEADLVTHRTCAELAARSVRPRTYGAARAARVAAAEAHQAAAQRARIRAQQARRLLRTLRRIAREQAA